MKTSVEGPTTVYRHDYNGKPYYSVLMIQKDIDGNNEYGYINASFRRGTDISDKTRIDIKKGWLKFYKKDKMTVPQIFISEFELADEAPPQPFEAVDEQVPF